MLGNAPKTRGRGGAVSHATRLARLLTPGQRLWQGRLLQPAISVAPGRASGYTVSNPVQPARAAVILPPNALASLAMLCAVCLWSSATPTTKLAVQEIAVAEFVACAWLWPPSRCG